MSEQQSAAIANAAIARQDGPDDREPTPERQAALRAAYLANVEAGKAPYAGVRITRRGELLWVLTGRGWLQIEESPAPNLRDADLSQTNLSSIDLQVADLRGTDLLISAQGTKLGLRAYAHTAWGSTLHIY